MYIQCKYQIINPTRHDLTIREIIDPDAITRKRPKYESERKAPNVGMKFEMAPHKNNMFAPVAVFKWYSFLRYIIILARSPTIATLSNDSIPTTIE